MSTVKMTAGLIDRMLNKFSHTFRAERAALPKPPDFIPAGIGDELYSCLWPLADEEAARNAMPAWAIRTTDAMYMYYDDGYRGGIVTLSTRRLYLGEYPGCISVPGLSQVRWDGHSFTYKVEDVEQIQLPNFKAFVKECKEVREKAKELDDRIIEEQEKLRKFLEQHRTLQQAVKEFGPSLLTFVPDYVMKIYNEVLPPKPKKVKTEKVEPEKIDIDSVIARAVSEQLGMNGDKTAVELAQDAASWSPPFVKLKAGKTYTFHTQTV